MALQGYNQSSINTAFSECHLFGYKNKAQTQAKRITWATVKEKLSSVKARQ